MRLIHITLSFLAAFSILSCASAPEVEQMVIEPAPVVTPEPEPQPEPVIEPDYNTLGK